MLAWANPESGLASCTAGGMQKMVIMMQRIRLNIMKNWLSVHDWPAKKWYISPVSVMIIPAVEPTRIHCRQRIDSQFSQFSRHISVHDRVRSTRTRRSRIKTVAPRGATQLPQKMKRPLHGGWRHLFRGEQRWKSHRKVDTNKECAKDDVSQSKSEGNRSYSVGPSASTVTLDIAIAGLLSLLDGLIGEG